MFSFASGLTFLDHHLFLNHRLQICINYKWSIHHAIERGKTQSGLIFLGENILGSILLTQTNMRVVPVLLHKIRKTGWANMAPALILLALGGN